MTPHPDTTAFLKVLDPSDTTTGGGTAASICGAMAAGLTAMVARLSVGRKMADPETDYTAIIDDADRLNAELFEGGAEDSSAFCIVSAAYRMPKDTVEEQRARRKAIRDGMLHAARVPLANARGCRRVLELARKLENRSNPNASSDLECAVHLAKAGLKGCIANVRINLPHINDDSAREEIEAYLEKLAEAAEIEPEKGESR